MKAYLIDTHLLIPSSRLLVKVNTKVTLFKKTAVFGGISVLQIQLDLFKILSQKTLLMISENA